MFRVWTKNLGRVGKSEAHVYFLALTCSDAEQLGKPFLLKGNFIPFNTQTMKYYQLREVKNNLGDATKAHFIALSMFSNYSETKSDRILLPERRVRPTQHHPDLTADN